MIVVHTHTHTHTQSLIFDPRCGRRRLKSMTFIPSFCGYFSRARAHRSDAPTGTHPLMCVPQNLRCRLMVAASSAVCRVGRWSFCVVDASLQHCRRLDVVDRLSRRLIHKGTKPYSNGVHRSCLLHKSARRDARKFDFFFCFLLGIETRHPRRRRRRVRVAHVIIGSDEVKL